MMSQSIVPFHQKQPPPHSPMNTCVPSSNMNRKQPRSSRSKCRRLFLLNFLLLAVLVMRRTTLDILTMDHSYNESTLLNPAGISHPVVSTVSIAWDPDDLTHAGARFANGSLGYVADVSAVKQRILQQYQQDNNDDTATTVPWNYLPVEKDSEDVCHTPPGDGTERPEGYTLLTETVQVNQMHGTTTRLLCAIYTTENMKDQIQAVGDTWGWRCDGFFAASNATVPEIGAIDLVHKGDESYQNMWQKTRSILAYMYDNYYDKFDFFYLCGDDTHLIVENLRGVLDKMMPLAANFPLFLGSWFRSPVIFPKRHDYYIIHGGSGYVLNKIALKMLVVDLADCFSDKRSSSEDRWVTQCLNRVGVPGNTSGDDQGRQRFHPEDPYFVATFDGINNNSTSPYQYNGASSAVEMYGPSYQLWARKYPGGFRAGASLVSPESVAFHRLKTPAVMKRHHAILYEGSCPSGAVLSSVIK